MPKEKGYLKTLCQESVECYYKVDGTCEFKNYVIAILSVLQDEYHRGSNCIVNLADIFDFPCKNLDEDGRQGGTGNLFVDMGLGK